MESAAAPTGAPPVGKTDSVRSGSGFETVARRTSSVTRWVRSLSRHQAHELNAMVVWLCVCAFIIVNQPGLLRFRTTCDASRALQKHLAAAVFSFEGWASWGTPKGRARTPPTPDAPRADKRGSSSSSAPPRGS